MEPLPQKLHRLWFTQNIRYLVYFLREFTGILIAIWVIHLILANFASVAFQTRGNNFIYPTIASRLFHALKYTNPIAFYAAIFHSLTWLYVMTKLSPIPLKGIWKIIAYTTLIAVWLVLSYFIWKFSFEFYARI